MLYRLRGIIWFGALITSIVAVCLYATGVWEPMDTRGLSVMTMTILAFVILNKGNKLDD